MTNSQKMTTTSMNNSNTKRKVREMKNFGVKTKHLSHQIRHRRSSSRVGPNQKTDLHQKNYKLAATLNQTRMVNAALCQRLNQLNGEILEVRGKMATLEKEKQIITTTAKTSESESQRRLAEIVGPVLNILNQSKDNLSSSINMLNSLHSKQSYQSQRDRRSAELAMSWLQKTSTIRDTPPQALVSPRVNGHEIHKPKIRIARLDLASFPNVILPDNPDTTADVPESDRNSVAEDHDDEDESPAIMVRSRLRRRSGQTRSNAIATSSASRVSMVEEENEEDDESEDSDREMVLLFPRVVLEKITLTPTRRSSHARLSSQSRSEVGTGNSSPMVHDSPSQPTTSTSSSIVSPEQVTPVSRETFNQFTQRLGGLDPMEGPSWLFQDDEEEDNHNNGPLRRLKPRSEKRQEHSLKARLSSASKKLNLEPAAPQEPTTAEIAESAPVVESSVEEPAPPEEVEPPRRGRRAAAAAASKSLKEMPINSKMRQGDPGSQSVYDNFVPGSKRKSDKSKSTKNKRKKSDGDA